MGGSKELTFWTMSVGKKTIKRTLRKRAFFWRMNPLWTSKNVIYIRPKFPNLGNCWVTFNIRKNLFFSVVDFLFFFFFCSCVFGVCKTMDASSDEGSDIEIVSMSLQLTIDDDDSDDATDAPTLSSSCSSNNLAGYDNTIKSFERERSPSITTIENARAVQDGTFSWSLLDGLEGTMTRTYKADEVLVLANSVNNSLFRLLDGTVRIERSAGVLEMDLRNSKKQLQEEKLSFGKVSSSDSWPVVCEMSALSETEKLTSMSILSNGVSEVQIISKKALFSFLFSNKERDDVACLFFETMCRHYTQKLRGLPTRKLEGGWGGLYAGCLTINGEVVIFSSKVQTRSRLGKSDRMLSFSASYVALLKPKEKGGGYEVSFDANERRGAILNLEEVASATYERQHITIRGSNGVDLVFKFGKKNISLIEQALKVKVEIKMKKKKDEKGKRKKSTVEGGSLLEGGERKRKTRVSTRPSYTISPTSLASRVRREEGLERSRQEAKAGHLGLTQEDYANLREIAVEEFYEPNQMICCRGVRFFDLLLLVDGNYVAVVEGIESRCFVLDHLFIGEISLMLDCPPTASVYAGETGCRVMRVPYAAIIATSRKDKLFLCRLYQSFLHQIWKRILSHDHRQFIEKPDIEEQKTGEDHASTFFKKLQGNKSQPPPSPSSSPQLLHSSSRSALPSIKSTPIPQSSSDEFLGLGLGGGGGGAVSHYSIRMKTLLHEVFSQDANKEYETISAIIDVVGDQVPSASLYPLLLAAIRFHEALDSQPDFLRFLVKDAIEQDPSAPLRQDCAATRLVGCYLVVDGEEWFHACLKKAIMKIIENPTLEFEDEELTELSEDIFRRMGQNIGLLSPKVASLLRWVLDLLERVVEKGQVQPIIGNLLILRGINRLLLSPFHFSSLGVKKWNPIQTKNAVRLSKLNMKMAQKKERKEDASVSWVSFLVSGDDEEEEEEEEEGEPLFALFLKKIPKREVLNRKIKEQDEVMGRLSGEQKNNVVTASLMVFRDFLSRYILLLWSHPTLSSLMQKITTTALSEIMFQKDNTPSSPISPSPSPSLLSSSPRPLTPKSSPSISSFNCSTSSSTSCTSSAASTFDDVTTFQRTPPPAHKHASNEQIDPIMMLGGSNLNLSMTSSTPLTLRSDRSKPSNKK